MGRGILLSGATVLVDFEIGRWGSEMYVSMYVSYGQNGKWMMMVSKQARGNALLIG